MTWFALVSLLTFGTVNPSLEPIPPFNPDAEPVFVQHFAVVTGSQADCQFLLGGLLLLGSPSRHIRLDVGCAPVPEAGK